MDIAALSMGISQADVINNVETAVLAKSLDTMKESGAVLIDMMNRLLWKGLSIRNSVQILILRYKTVF